MCVLTTESQSNHSSQSDSGVSEMASSGHTRSQSVVSSIFSDAWRRGTQGEVQPHSEHTHAHKLCPFLSCRCPVYRHFPCFPSAFLPAVKDEGTYGSSFLCRRREWRLDRKWCNRHVNRSVAAFKPLTNGVCAWKWPVCICLWHYFIWLHHTCGCSISSGTQCVTALWSSRLGHILYTVMSSLHRCYAVWGKSTVRQDAIVVMDINANFLTQYFSVVVFF